jgi:hypothetical protein
MQEAADELGLTVEAIRKRVQRGSMQSDKGEDGRRYVYLDKSHREVQDESSEGELIEELRDRVRSLERMLEEEREARTEERRRHDTLMAQLMQRIPELEPPAQEPPESPLRAQEGETTTTPGVPQTGSGTGASRPWWRRILGG